MLIFDTINDGKDFVSKIENKKIIFYSLIEDIKDALIFDLSFITIFVYEKEGIHHFLYKEGWVYTLNKALKYFESIEDYEQCIDIRNLIITLDDILFIN